MWTRRGGRREIFTSYAGFNVYIGQQTHKQFCLLAIKHTYIQRLMWVEMWTRGEIFTSYAGFNVYKYGAKNTNHLPLGNETHNFFSKWGGFQYSHIFFNILPKMNVNFHISIHIQSSLLLKLVGHFISRFLNWIENVSSIAVGWGCCRFSKGHVWPASLLAWQPATLASQLENSGEKLVLHQAVYFIKGLIVAPLAGSEDVAQLS